MTETAQIGPVAPMRLEDLAPGTIVESDTDVGDGRLIVVPVGSGRSRLVPPANLGPLTCTCAHHDLRPCPDSLGECQRCRRLVPGARQRRHDAR